MESHLLRKATMEEAFQQAAVGNEQRQCIYVPLSDKGIDSLSRVGISHYCEIGERKRVLIHHFIGFCFGSIHLPVHMYEMDFCFKSGRQLRQIRHCFFILWLEVRGIGDMTNGAHRCTLRHSDYRAGRIHEGMGGNAAHHLLYGAALPFRTHHNKLMPTSSGDINDLLIYKQAIICPQLPNTIGRGFLRQFSQVLHHHRSFFPQEAIYLMRSYTACIANWQVVNTHEVKSCIQLVS